MGKKRQTEKQYAKNDPFVIRSLNKIDYTINKKDSKSHCQIFNFAHNLQNRIIGKSGKQKNDGWDKNTGPPVIRKEVSEQWDQKNIQNENNKIDSNETIEIVLT